MSDEDRVILRALSLLLNYPQETNSGPELSILPAGPAKETLEGFCRYRLEKPILRLQEEYTGTFDLNPSTSLNLTFHHPEAQSRGKLLLGLKELYEDAGYENLPGELPDYLPLMLEFLSVCPDPYRRRICGEYSAAVALLASRLKEAASPFAELMELVKDAFCANS